MATLNIHRVNALPDVPDAHSLYVIRKQEFGRAELVFTTADGELLPVLDTASVQNMVSTAIGTTSSITIFQNIEERDNYDFQDDSIVYVVEAGDDPVVNSGSALYFYKKDTEAFTLIICAKNTSWTNILGRPDVSVEDMEDAVAKKHIHENFTILDAIGEGDNESLFYKGKPVSDVQIATIDW